MSSDTEVAIKATAKDLIHIERVEQDGFKPFYVAPDNHKLVGIEQFLEKPDAIEAKFDFQEPNPFIDYLNQFKKPQTRIVPFKDKDLLQSYVDFHDTKDGTDAPSWCKHVVSLKLQKDKDLQAWLARDGKGFSQRDIADFFLDYKDVFSSIDGSDVVEIASKIKVISNEEINSDVQGGGVDILYKRKEQMTLDDGRKVPDVFTVDLPVFVGFSVYRFPFRLAWRKQGTAIEFKVMLIRPHLILDAAFGEVAQHVAAMTEVKAFGYEPAKKDGA